MCGLHHLVFRQGHVLASNRKLSYVEAIDIARDVKDNIEAAIRDIAAVLRSYATDAEAELRILNGDTIGTARVQKGNTVQVDFPVIEFFFNGETYETRTVVTVCVEERQSKCWTRVSMRDNEDDYPMAAKIFEELEALAARINRTVITWYDGRIKAGVGAQYGVEIDYTMNVRTASGDDVRFDKYFAKVFEERPVPADGDWLVIKEEVTKALTNINPNVPHAIRNADDNGKSYRRFGIATQRSNPLVVDYEVDDPIDSETVNAIVSVEYDDNKAEFTGIGYDRLWEKESSPITTSSLANRSIAVEYGALF